MEYLTDKEEKVIELIQQGRSKIDAVMEAYNCKTRQSATAYSSRLFKREKVRNELRKIQNMASDKLADKNVSFLNLLLRHITMEEIAEKLADNLRSKDKRVSDSALEKVMRVVSAYPKEEMQTLDGANFQIVMVGGKKENEVKTIEGKVEEVMPMLMQKNEETKELPVIQEGIVEEVKEVEKE
jgi:hypothetical protein